MSEKEFVVSATIDTIEKRQVTVLEYDGNFFDLRKRKEKTPPSKQVTLDTFIEPRENLTKSPAYKERKIGKDKGEYVARMGNNVIYGNVLRDMKEGINNGLSSNDLMQIVSPYYPNMKSSSLRVSKNSYLRYINGKPAHHFEKKTKRRAPRGKIYIQKYLTYVSKEDIAKVTKSIHRWDFTATSASIQKDTGLKLQLVRAILHHLSKKSKIYHTIDKKVWVYHPAPTEAERKTV